MIFSVGNLQLTVGRLQLPAPPITALAGVETCQWSTTHHLDPPDLSWHGCYSDWGPAASGGQTVLVNNRNGGRLRLIASCHYYYYYITSLTIRLLGYMGRDVAC